MSLYRSIINDSWKSTFRNKYLWFFGLFAVLLGNGGEYEVIFRSLDQQNTMGSIFLAFFRELFMNLGAFLNFGKVFAENPGTGAFILSIYLFILVVLVFVIWMMIVSQIAIVDATAAELKDKDPNIKRGLERGIRYFWPVFLFNTVIKATILIALYVLAQSFNFYLSILVFVIIIPLVISISFILKYSIAYVVIRKEKVKKSLQMGLELFKNNWIISVELAIFLYLFTIAAGTVFMFASFNIDYFFRVLALEFPKAGFFFITFAIPNAMLILLVFIGSILAVFQISNWTRLFLILDSKGGKSKIERVFGK